MMMGSRRRWIQALLVGLVVVVVASAGTGAPTTSTSTFRRRGGIFDKQTAVLTTSAATAGFAATATTAPLDMPVVVADQDTSSENNNNNLLVSAVGFVKDTVVQTVDGVKTSWSNYGQCQAIRSKQKQYKQALLLEWQNNQNKNGMELKECKAQLQLPRYKFAGITYEEYLFLKRGLADRNKLTQLAMWSWAAPRFLPYMIMMNSDMLPSPFQHQRSKSKTGETKLQQWSRCTSHAVLSTLLQLEKDAHVAPALAQFNPLGRKKTKRAMQQAQHVGRELSHFWSSQQSPQDVMTALSNQLYSQEPWTKPQRNLVGSLPKCVFRGFQQVLDQKGGSASFPNTILPVFFARKKLLAYLQQLQEADEFLVHQEVNLDSLSLVRLQEACQERMVLIPNNDNDNDDNAFLLKQSLQTWLDLTVVQPNNNTATTNNKPYFHANLARTALLGWNLAQSTQSSNSASYLARTLYQQNHNVPTTVQESTSPNDKDDDNNKRERKKRGKKNKK